MIQRTIPVNLQALVDEKVESNLILKYGFMSARRKFGDQIITSFIEKVPENGEALLLRFIAFQKEKVRKFFRLPCEPNIGYFILYQPSFVSFVASVITPDPS